MNKKNITTLLILSLGLFFLSCNVAENGFNAPTGATVTFISTGDDFGFPDEADPGCYPSALALATVQVQVPISAVAEANGAEFQVGNEVQGVIQNTGPTIYKFKEGVETFLPLDSLVDVVASGTMPFVTNDQGLFTFVYSITVCYDADGAKIGSGLQLTADIGVALGILAISY